MNLLPFEGSLRRGDRSVSYFDGRIDVPEVREDIAKSELTLGVRPEHVVLSEPAASADGFSLSSISAPIKSSRRYRSRKGEGPPFFASGGQGWRDASGVRFQAQKLVVFNSATGRATQSALFEDCGPWLILYCSASRSASATSRRSRICRSRSPTANFWCFLGRPARERPRCCGWWRGSSIPIAARYSIDGRDVTRDPPAARDVAFVFQQYSLYPHMSVYDNLAFPLRSPTHRVSENEIRKAGHHHRREAAVSSSKLQNRATRLSGGEMQRVAIGRALVRQPRVYLMDEPLSSLDAKLRADLRVELKRIQMELGATVLYVTHDQVEAMTMATRIGVLNEGALLQLGSAAGDLRTAE